MGQKDSKPARLPDGNNSHRVILPFKDQKSADEVKKKLSHLSKTIGHILQPVFASQKIVNVLNMSEPKPSLINQQWVVYNYQCDLCDAKYVGYTNRHLHQRIDNDVMATSKCCVKPFSSIFTIKLLW